jgi:chitinase
LDRATELQLVHRIGLFAQFTQRLNTQHSLEQMLEITLSLLVQEQQVKGVALYQRGESIAQIGIAPHRLIDLAIGQDQACFVIDADYSLAIAFHQPLSAADVVFYRSLNQQLALVRAQRYEWGRQPQLLADLYSIASRRDKLRYVRADRGYCGIYAADLAAPLYITLRLRVIRLYFDDSVLLQVHRSYLVNPRKVEKACKRGREGWLLQMGADLIPLARQSLERVQGDFPQWFA